MRTIVVLASALALTACASAPLSLNHIKVDRRVGEEPLVDVVTERSVGEVIYEVYNYEVRTDSSTRLLEPLTIDVLAAEAHLSTSDPFVAVVDQGHPAYCSAQPVLRVGGQSGSARVCLRDSDSDKQFDLWRSPDGPPARKGWARLKKTVGFRSETSVEMVTGGGFRSELLYQGLSSGVVSILYREYLDSLVRPAFQQDLSYTLEEEGATEISFRTIKMTVHSANNNLIRYTLNRGLTY